MLIMIFLVGTLLGLLGGALLSVRYIRQEMAANMAPRLSLILAHLNNLEAEVNLALATRMTELGRRAPDPTLPGE